MALHSGGSLDQPCSPQLLRLRLQLKALIEVIPPGPGHLHDAALAENSHVFMLPQLGTALPSCQFPITIFVEELRTKKLRKHPPPPPPVACMTQGREATPLGPRGR